MRGYDEFLSGTQPQVSPKMPAAPSQQAPAPQTEVLYDAGYNASAQQDVEVKKSSVNTTSLALTLRQEFDAAESARQLVNLRWLEDLRQYRGMYDESVKKVLECRGGSTAFYRLTTTKVNTMTARLMDLLFPQRIKNWAIEATPDPMLPQDVLVEEMREEVEARVQAAMQVELAKVAEQGFQPPDEIVQKMYSQITQSVIKELDTAENRVRVAKERAKRMESVIDDQLKEGSSNGKYRPSWRQNCRLVVKSACLYGMGILKGPLVEEIDVKRFMPTKTEDGQTIWSEETFKTTLRPFHEAVPVWDIFPDPGARTSADLRYVWQRHTKTDKDLIDLLRIPGFNNSAILGYINAHPDGDAEFSSWEEQVRELNEDNGSNAGMTRLKNRYTLLERWGYLTGRELREAGVDIAEEDLLHVFSSCVWMLGDLVIKASINPLEGVDIPFYFFPYQEDDTSFWPEGIAYQLRTPQACINAAIRAIQDNTALSSGPIIGINVANLRPGERLDDMKAGKFFLFEKPNIRLNDCIQASVIPSTIDQGLALVSFWSNAADEISTPRFNQGDGNVSGAGETASGLSMLMGASNILLKDHVKDFDDTVVAPFIRAMFKWNMAWNEDNSIKGDFEVVASGSQSLIAKEVRAQQIPILIQYLQIPDFIPYLKPKELLEVALEQTDLPSERILRTEDEAEQFQQEQRTQQAQAEVEAIMQKLQQSGMTPEQINQQLLLILAQTMSEANSHTPQIQQQQGSVIAPKPMQGPDVPPVPPEANTQRQLPIRPPV